MSRAFFFRTHDDDPEVRGTVARLRLSVLAVAWGTGGLIVLGLLAAYAELPRWCFLLGSVLVVTVQLWAVRAPLRGAHQHAVDLAEASRQLHESTLETFAALSAAVEAKDRYTAGHGLRVTLVSMLIAQELDMPDADMDVLRHAATFHDIGKIAVPDGVLQKPGRLDDDEFEAMKVHPIEGARICAKLQALRDAVPLIRSHHERMDGRGYPDGLVAQAIPLGARVIAVADAWDAITSDRPYRRGQPPFVALEEIRRSAGAQFDPVVVRAFVEVLAKDPWMFGLTPEDVVESHRTLPAPTPASRGADHDVVVSGRDVDWSTGFDGEGASAA
ncbi:MAG: hypothetical protein JWO69_1455 [Thermoleophilia bacterium]|jgi:putative nucleotidyltransferase with HDIG domain|nr:hypothetical protein [Thermoleophilia bacterium]